MGHSFFAFRSLLSVTAFVFIVTVTALGAATDVAERPMVLGTVSSGRTTFRQFCAPCHGPDGKGRGPIASSLLEAPTDLTQIRRRHNGVFPQGDFESMLLALTDTSAPSSMPTHMILWGPIFLSVNSDAASAWARVVDLLAFIESIQEQ